MVCNRQQCPTTESGQGHGPSGVLLDSLLDYLCQCKGLPIIESRGGLDALVEDFAERRALTSAGSPMPPYSLSQLCLAVTPSKHLDLDSAPEIDFVLIPRWQEEDVSPRQPQNVPCQEGLDVQTKRTPGIEANRLLRSLQNQMKV